jgi:SAM-dependent methyltransferase
MRSCPQCGTPVMQREWSCAACGWRAPVAEGMPLFAPAAASESEGFDPIYFEDLAQLESGNFWFRARNRTILWALARYFPRAESMLEVGCGTGFVLAAIRGALPHLRLCASEVLVEGLARTARRVQDVEFLQMDARSMPFRDEFDVIGAFDVLEHIADDRAVLREAHRALKPGGGLLLTVPQHAFLWSAADDYAHHQRRYSRGDLRRRVEDAGFGILRCTSFVSLLMPLLLVSRLTKRDPRSFDPHAEFAIPSGINWGLERVLDLERLLIQAGISLPFGGSLLLAAHKV